MREFIVALNNFVEESDRVIELSRDILTCKNQDCNLWTCRSYNKECVNEVQNAYVEIIKCISSLEELAKIYANALKYSVACGNSPWDPRDTKKKSLCGCSFLDPQC